jgi:prepilin-type N-terminal cleavage/methylation domain-containing protein
MLYKDRRGFTVVELLVAITVFALTIPALAAGVRGLITANNRSRDLTLVSLTAENKIEELRSAGFNTLSNGTHDFSSELPPEISKPRSAAYTIASPSSDVKSVTIAITYWDYTRTKTVTYQTLVGELGVGQ